VTGRAGDVQSPENLDFFLIQSISPKTNDTQFMFLNKLSKPERHCQLDAPMCLRSFRAKAGIALMKSGRPQLVARSEDQIRCRKHFPLDFFEKSDISER
jgi:hypothetical protein